MGMIIKNNMSAKRTLNTLNKNEKALSKAMKKIGTGMKINGAADDASYYSISERMRVQIRSLDQANYNAQNAASLMRVAEGAAQSTTDILRTLKAKAIDAANDTNTDADRAIIQKELDQSIDQISDNSNVTFNGRKLFDGTADVTDDVKYTIVKALNSEWMKTSLDMIQDAIGLSFTDNNAMVKEIEVEFENDPGSGTLAYVTSSSLGSKTVGLKLTVNMGYYEDMDIKDTNGASPSAGAAYLDRTIAHELTHAVMAAHTENWGNVPKFITEGMAEAIHGIDDARKPDLESIRGRIGAGLTAARGSKESDSYSVGYAFMRYMNKQFGDMSVKSFIQDIGINGGDDASINSAVSSATGGRYATLDALKAKFQADANAAASDRDFLLDKCGIDLDNDDTGSILGSDAGNGETRDAAGTVPEGLNTRLWYMPSSNSTMINGLEVVWPEFKRGSGLNFLIGTKANVMISHAFSDISAEGLGLKSDGGETLSVGTRTKAKQAITILDHALDKVLDQHTTIGAIISRLEYTQNNLSINSENTTHSESVYRDADMAKEMVDYAKSNVLMQAAQSMLAQANQSSSNVISLLQ